MGNHNKSKNQQLGALKNQIDFLKAIINGDLSFNLGDEKFPLPTQEPEKELRIALAGILSEKDKYRDLFENAPAGYAILDASFHLTEINERGKKLLSIEEDVAGKLFSDFIAEKDLEPFQFFLKGLKAGKDDEESRVTLKNASGVFAFRGVACGVDEKKEQLYRIMFFNTSCAEKTKSEQSNNGNSTETEVLSLDGAPASSPKKVTTDEVLGKLTVLITDDDEIARVYLGELLRNKCKTLLYAKNGKEAVEYIVDGVHVDLVLMDIKMPIMDGYSATIKIKEVNKDIIIVAQTAYALASDREKALAAGCNDYLAKPLVKEDLFSVIEKFFKRA
ncbi:PAS domain S-box-containing protein [Mariniphaga anaerophila]|uniref:PAS domain S-box-containing protein n=1 Tax=Mariniphaga anaerophila TaxID=1484053 RepID=A0A1M4YEU7_9BACT|nr:response regulator [Mariniphaga anaerophila]SHF04123.1 PAS domain S-box-containing protein [Mariniphaga anaerophila]